MSFTCRVTLSCAALLLVAASPMLAAPADCSGISGTFPSNDDLIGDLTTVRVASGLSSPVHVTLAPGDNERLFIVEQGGRIKIAIDGVVLPVPFLDIDPIVRSSGNEEGLLSVAFHPDYDTPGATNEGMFFVYYTNNGGNQVIERYRVGADPNLADPLSGVVFLTINHPSFSNHNGGQVAFGPDGHLYAGVGDGGSACDPGGGVGNGQNKEVLLGKLLRLNVDQFPYTTAGNPFVGVAGADEIWSYGLRNPYTFSFDRDAGTIWIADVGQGAWEEIDCGPSPLAGGGGENYGWVNIEGNACGTCGAADCSPPSYRKPTYVFSLAGAPCAVIGGSVYRGCRMAELRGAYFLADHCADFIRSIKPGTNMACPLGQFSTFIDRTSDLAPGGGMSITDITSFGEDHQGEIYIVDRGGEVFKIIPDLDIMETSGPGATPLLFGDDWTFENLAANIEHDIDAYKVYRADNSPTGPFACIQRVDASACSGAKCVWVGGDATTPPLGEVFYYLTTAEQKGGPETTAGARSDGSLRSVDTGSACP